MPAFQKEVPNPLSKEAAVERLKSFVDSVRERFKDQVSAMDGQWVDNVMDFSLTTFGFTVKGKLIVEEDVARVEGQLPFAALAFRGKIEESIGDELRKELAAGGGDTTTTTSA